MDLTPGVWDLRGIQPQSSHGISRGSAPGVWRGTLPPIPQSCSFVCLWGQKSLIWGATAFMVTSVEHLTRNLSQQQPRSWTRWWPISKQWFLTENTEQSRQSLCCFRVFHCLCLSSTQATCARWHLGGINVTPSQQQQTFRWTSWGH